MQHHQLIVTKKANYYTLGTPGPHIRQLWLVCHGYAQLADEFLRDFDVLNNPHTLVVAPEGLHYFYKKGFDGAVGAAWMTRRHRLDAIEDNADYLQALYTHQTAQLPADVRIVLLGFSQGVATVCRWVLNKKPHFHDLVLWAGLPPEDLDYGAQQAYLSDKNLYLLYGSNDPFLTPDRLASVQDIEAKNGIDFGEQRFEGGHEIQPEVLQSLMRKLN